MAFSGNFMCTSFKQQILEAVHDFRNPGGDSFYCALYDNSASFTAATTAYTATNEVAASGSYVAGGGLLVSVSPTTSGTTAFPSFNNFSWTSATINAYGAMIYNDSAAGNPSVCILDFGGAKTSTAGTFTIVFPAATASDAIIRIA